MKYFLINPFFQKHNKQKYVPINVKLNKRMCIAITDAGAGVIRLHPAGGRRAGVQAR